MSRLIDPRRGDVEDDAYQNLRRWPVAGVALLLIAVFLISLGAARGG